MYLLKNKDSRKWMKSCCAWFLLKDYAEFQKFGHIKKFMEIYNCVDTKEIKNMKIKEYIKTKRNTRQFIIDMNSNYKRFIKTKNKTKYMVIPLVSCNENLYSSSSLQNSSLGCPNFTGWFWNDCSQKELHLLNNRCFKQLLDVEKVKEQLNALSDDPMKYWAKQSNRLHVTAKYIGNHADDASIEYLERVYKQFYTIAKVKVTGILLTKRNISGHAELPEDYKWMFDPEKQDDFSLLTHVTLATSKIGKPVDSGPDQLDVQTMIKEKKTPDHEYDLKCGKLQDWGDCRFYIALNTERRFNVMFMPKI